MGGEPEELLESHTAYTWKQHQRVAISITRIYPVRGIGTKLDKCGLFIILGQVKTLFRHAFKPPPLAP